MAGGNNGSNAASASGATVYVNGNAVMTLPSTSSESGASRASTVAQRLDAIFGNTARDLDFITPTFYNGNHEVVCADVTYPNGCTCFACDNLSSSNCPNVNTATCSGQTQGLPENIYDTDNSTNDLSGSQAYIVTATSADVSATGQDAWALTLQWANNARAALIAGSAYGPCGHEVSTLQPATGTGLPTDTLIVQATGSFYGDPNSPYYQGECGGSNNICSLKMANGDVFHTCDVTVAVPSSYYSTYKNEWVRVYYGSNSVVARITDVSPSGDIDLAYEGVAQPLGFPGSGTITLKAT